jgi:hypothetical protein
MACTPRVRPAHTHALGVVANAGAPAPLRLWPHDAQVKARMQEIFVRLEHSLERELEQLGTVAEEDRSGDGSSSRTSEDTDAAIAAAVAQDLVDGEGACCVVSVCVVACWSVHWCACLHVGVCTALTPHPPPFPVPWCPQA